MTLKGIRYRLKSIREYLTWLKVRKRPYLEYYREIMKQGVARDYKTATGGKPNDASWNILGEIQLVRLKYYGMKPENTLFDLGCGSLRGGRHMINYLNPGNYTGNDISPDILEYAKALIDKENLKEKNPRIVLTNDLSFNEFDGETFDYISADSVLSHMPPEDIDELLKNMKRIMHKKTEFYPTVFLNDENRIYPFNNRKNFSYPLDWFITTGEKHGLAVTLLESDTKQKLLKITPI